MTARSVHTQGAVLIAALCAATYLAKRTIALLLDRTDTPVRTPDTSMPDFPPGIEVPRISHARR